jgi:hypothetical protein
MLDILINLVAVALLAAFLFYGFKFLKKRNAARPDGSGGTPPGSPGDEK